MKIRNKTRISSLATTIQHNFGSPGHGNQRRKQQKRKTVSKTNKKKKKRTQIHKIRDERGEVTKDITEIQRILRDYYIPINLYQ